MLGLLMGAAALGLTAALYYLLWGWNSRGKKKNSPDASALPGKDSPAPGTKGAGMEPRKPKRPVWQERTSAAIDEIAGHLRFATGKAKLKRIKTGEVLAPSPMPTDELTIRPIRGAGELPRVLTNALADDDDMFYAKFAGQSLPVVEYQERVDVMEDVAGVPRKVIVLLVDVSGSMEEFGRISWTRELCQKVIERATVEDAEVALLPFTSAPGLWCFAKDAEGYARLTAELPDILIPGGGTYISGALREGLRYLSDESFTDRKILLVTDGQDGTIDTSTLRQSLSKLDAELHTVCLGIENPDLYQLSTQYDLFRD